MYPSLVKGSWNPDSQRNPWCFVLPSTAEEVSETITALKSAGNGAGDWHIAVRSGGHGSDNQNSITNGIVIDLSQLNGTTYDETTNIASVGTGARWGDVYADLQEHDVSITGGRQAVVGVGGLILGGGVGWHTPRRGFGCDSVVNYEVVLSSGEIINANALSHPDLWQALKGGSSNFGVVTRFDIEAFPAQNLTLERRTVGEEYQDEFIDAMVGFADLDESYQANAMATVLSYQPGAGIILTVTEVNTVNDNETMAFDAFNEIPLLTPSNKQSLTLPAAAAVDAPELTPGAQYVNILDETTMKLT
jgi:FAD/FMN-containing dehydrogenase